jgi:ADA HAT complex component 1
VAGAVDIERAKEAIEEQFSLEILLKHDELRLINQELAKCQVALEQLRRCHLIPYPVTAPTPEQMLNIANGSGPSLQPKSGDKLPQWAPPFGVTDGPYSRHYAKWLIPDPKFDGIQPEIFVHADAWRTRSVMEGRSTRNNLTEPGISQGKGRPSRSSAGQKLQALSSGYPPPKDKSGPCVLKRSDGQTVKLVCIDCHRENFSSTQGFINHCRIAHKRDFKSHEEAAVHCGHSIEVAETPVKAGVVEEKKPTVSSSQPSSGLAHPFTRAGSLTDSEACFSVVRRIQQSLELYRQGKLSGASSVTAIPGKSSMAGAKPKPTSGFSPSTDSPHLSRLLQSRGFGGNLGALVEDAKTKIDFEQLASPTDDESEDRESSATPVIGGLDRPVVSQATTGVRMPTRAVMAPAAGTSRRSSNKGTLAHPAPYVTPVPTPTPHIRTGLGPEMAIDEDMLDITELSPNTAVSNNAPSLVSDDGEYDDSADSDSASEMDVSIGADSISDMEEIDIDDDHTGTRTLRHHGSTDAGPGTRVRLSKGDNKHVSFVDPLKEKEKTKQSQGRGINIENIH